MASRVKTGRGRTTVPIFLLVPQVKLPKRLDLARDATCAYDVVPGLIVANWIDLSWIDLKLWCPVRGRRAPPDQTLGWLCDWAEAPLSADGAAV